MTLGVCLFFFYQIWRRMHENKKRRNPISEQTNKKE